jgi:hypothetical protein
MTDVTVVIGAGGIGQAIARRISGRHVAKAKHTHEAVNWAKRGAGVNAISPA